MITPETVAPSTQPKGSWWLFYPLAIIIVSAVLFTPAGEADASRHSAGQQHEVSRQHAE